MNRILGFKRKKKNQATLGDTSSVLEKRGGAIDTKVNRIDQQLMDIKKKMKQTRNPSARSKLKKRAAGLIRQRKMYEKHQNVVMNQQMNIDNLQLTTETMQTNIESVNVMKNTAKQMKKQFKKIDLDDVEDLHDELEDLMQDSDEIGEILGQSFGVPDEIDDDEIMDELDMLDDEMGMDDGCLDALDTPSESIASGPTSSGETDEAKQLEGELMGM